MNMFSFRLSFSTFSICFPLLFQKFLFLHYPCSLICMVLVLDKFSTIIDFSWNTTWFNANVWSRLSLIFWLKIWQWLFIIIIFGTSLFCYSILVILLISVVSSRPWLIIRWISSRLWLIIILIMLSTRFPIMILFYFT